ncbi:hypothetical protein ES703_49478 [subsurface metagenome]
MSIKIPKNRKIVTCTVDKELWEFMRKGWFKHCHNDAEVLMGIIHYFMDMEEVKEDMDREKEARMFRL